MQSEYRQRLPWFKLLFWSALVSAMVVFAFFAGRTSLQPEIEKSDAAVTRARDELAVIKQDYNALLKGEMLKMLMRSPIEQGMKADEWEQRQRLQTYLLKEGILVVPEERR